MSYAKSRPGRPPLLTRLMVWLRRLPGSRWVFAQIRGDESAGREPATREELLDDSSRVPDNAPHGGVPEPASDVPAPAEPDIACDRESLVESASEETVASGEPFDDSLQVADDPPHGDVPEPTSNAPTPVAEPDVACEQESLVESASEETVASGELFDDSLRVTDDPPHGSVPEPTSDAPTPAAEPDVACEQETLVESASEKTVASGDLDNSPHVTGDPPHGSVPAPTSDVSTVAEPDVACEQESLVESASEETVASGELFDDSLRVTDDPPHGDVPAPTSDVSTAAEPDVACERETLTASASEEPAAPEEVLNGSSRVADDPPHGGVPEPTSDAPTPAAEPEIACERASEEPAALEELLNGSSCVADDPPHACADFSEPDISAPAEEPNDACKREALIRRRWAETGIKMWNPRVHGTGDVTLSIQGRVELLAPEPGEKLPRYDRLEFKVLNDQIICEGVAVDTPEHDPQKWKPVLRRDKRETRGDHAPTKR